MTSQPEKIRRNAHREPQQAVLVVGGGVAGIHAALQAAELGHRVFLLERNLAIGGHMAQLDKTFPTQDCSLCTLSPRLYAVSRHPGIEIITRARLDAVTGCAGQFQAVVTQRPSYVNPKRCIGCGQCHGKCPVTMPDPFNLEMGPTKAIRALYPQAVPMTHAIDPHYCLYFRSLKKSKKKRGACRRCEKICPTGAIDFSQKPIQRVLSVGAVIVAGGFSMLGGPELVHPAWLELPNVLTNLELERLLSSTGPTRGEIVLPQTGHKPRRIVFIQCMGSRDPVHGVAYCSSVCCSVALKQATLLVEHTDLERITICYIDLRTHGRECEQFLRRVQEIDKVHFVAGKIGSIERTADPVVLLLRGASEGRPWQISADLVVLAMGMRPDPEAVATARMLGLGFDQDGFVQVKKHHPVATGIDGIYACGTLLGPKSIPSTVQEAEAAAFHASQRLLVQERSSSLARLRIREKPAEAPEATREPRIGVFVCRCGTNIAGVLDTQALAEQAAKRNGVAYAREELFTCSTDATKRMAQLIEEQGLNRIVVASCSPRTHLPIFQEVAAKAGISPALVTMANIREQCAWIHPDRPKAAQAKARSLINQAIDRIRWASPAPMLSMPIVQKVLILGGGIAALVAAVHLADAGISCVLVERRKELGSRLRHAFFDPKKLNCCQLQRLFLERAQKHPRIRLFLETEIVRSEGRTGWFQITLQPKAGKAAGREPITLQVGTILVAIGANTLKPHGLIGYGESPQVITQVDLARLLATRDPQLNRIRRLTMIQCVGSRNQERPYCSRSCCQQATVHALELKKRYPHLQITILYRDLRTYGTTERLYQKARERGVQFLRYRGEALPEVRFQRFGRRGYVDLSWRAMDGTNMRQRCELVVLSTATVARPWATHLSRVLRLPITDNHFFLEKHIKLAPVETPVEGIYIAGQCHYPETLQESLVQGQTAAAKMLALLRKKNLHKLALVATINRALCSRCLSCYSVCPAGAVKIPAGGGPLSIDPIVCQGCGMCAAECPAGAIDVVGTQERTLRTVADSLLG